MRRRNVGTFVLISTLLLTCFGAAIITPARAVISFTVSATYTGGDTQQVFVTATAPSAGYPTRLWTLYYQNGTLVPGTGTSGTLDDVGGGLYTKTIPVMKFNAGEYKVNVYLDSGGDSGSQNGSFTIQHIFRFIGVPNANYDSVRDEVVIQSVPFYTTQDLNIDGNNANDLVPEAFITKKEWVLYNLDGGEVANGNLEYITILSNWGTSVPMAWKNGNFTIGARFTLTNGTTVETGSANRKPINRNNATEWYIIVFSIIGGAAAALFIFVGIHNKHNASRDIGKKKEKKEKKEIKVLEISKEEIKKAKAGKAPPPTEEVKEEPKGVTKKSGDLIFEVPKWEEGDADK